MESIETTSEGDGFIIWGVDDKPYGPVELPVLINWVQEERVTPATWVYSEAASTWSRAEKLPELQIIFSKRNRSSQTPMKQGEFNTGAIRRVKVLAELTEEQLGRFMSFMEVVAIRQWADVVKVGETGDAMYMIMEGELRVRLMVQGREKILTTLGVGEFFGEIALFDQGPRSADVVANLDSKLLKVSAEAFKRLIDEAPELAAPILHAIGKTLASRIRADNKRFKDDHSFRTASGG